MADTESCCYRIVAIDQHTQAVAAEQKHGWFPVNSRPRLPVSGVRKRINMLGAVTDDGDRLIYVTPNRFTAEVAKHFPHAVQQEFGKKLVIVLDNARYFRAKTLKKQAVGTGLLLEFLLSYLPDMNPLENGWLQLRAARANRLFRTLDDVKAYLSTTLPTLKSPKLLKVKSVCVPPNL